MDIFLRVDSPFQILPQNLISPGIIKPSIKKDNPIPKGNAKKKAQILPPSSKIEAISGYASNPKIKPFPIIGSIRKGCFSLLANSSKVTLGLIQMLLYGFMF